MGESAAESVLGSWNLEAGVVFALLLSAFVYLRGWRSVSRLAPARFPAWRAACFLGGLLAVFVAVCSPLDAFASWLLSVHMVQHLLLTMVAPPLVLLGASFLPMLSGLPRRMVRGLAPFLNEPALKKIGAFFVHPLVAAPLFMASNLFWHVPYFYELALGSRGWHQVEHLSFLGTALLFWWPVVQPWPSRPVWPRWAMVPYLLAVDLQNTALSGFFTFYGKVLYPSYAAAPRITWLSPEADQTAAGAIMWVPGSMAFLIPAAVIAVKCLTGSQVRPSQVAKPRRPLPAPPRRPFDLLRVPVLGAFFRWKYFRTSMQILLFGLAVLVVLDGLFGPQVAGMNLAGVLPWMHWRGLTVLALLVAGNLFCMACPFTFARDLGRKILPASFRWPRALRSKWPAVVLLAVFFWAYEFFGLWATPWWTAWIILGYFAAAVLVDGFFKGAAFCKHICPIGQFHFVSSLASPLEVRVREPSVCASCRTHDCLRGNATQRGCELHLFQPAKSGNMDCTFCLDCVKACPTDNVGIMAVPPGGDLLNAGRRSGVGDFAQRPDIAALVLVFTFAALANAAGMAGPVVELGQRLRGVWGGAAGVFGSALFFTFVLLVPLGAAWVCSRIGAAFSGISEPWRRIAGGFGVLLAPLGFSMWAAHFLFHFLHGLFAPWPVLQRAASDAGLSSTPPDWSSMPGVIADTTGLGILLLNAGCLYSLWLLWKKSCTAAPVRPAGIFMPWAFLVLLVYAFGLWLVFQPMEMRGLL
jgi:cytochrome c oxidase assembly factor CtaG